MKDLNKKTRAELYKILSDKHEEKRESRFAVSGSRQRNTKEARTLKKDIARVLTEINKRKKEINKS